MHSGLSSIKVDSVCVDDWARRVQSYWRYLGCGYCTVLLGPGSNSIRLIRKKVPETGLIAVALLFTEPLELPRERNYLWHEMGHLLGEQSKNPVLNEFFADRYAMETAISRSCTRVVEEIIFRCVDAIRAKKRGETYREAARVTVKYYQQYCRRIVERSKQETCLASS